jgi:amino acid transporter
MGGNVAATSDMTDDERTLAALGYKQELSRTWSSFSNFAISFSIISILAGCFTTFGVAWNAGGPIAISWVWPILSIGILIIGFCMSELVSAFPTSGGIYWWASKLGGAKAGYYTGWLNLIGLLAIVASVAYGCATFFDVTLSQFSAGWAKGYSLPRVFYLFIAILLLAALINIFSSKLLAWLNNISVWWHVFGAIAVVAILIAIPKHHSSINWMFSGHLNNTGFFGGSTSGFGFFFLVLPIGFLLTQYTITGYDASAHLSEETQAAANGAAKGIWRSIFYSAIGGYILLMAFLYAVGPNATKVTNAGGFVGAIFTNAMSAHWSGTVLIISTAGQFFCTVACMTSCTRMMFAFSRDGAVPGAKYWARLNKNKVPVNGVILTVVISLLITLPAIKSVNVALPDGSLVPSPVAFYAVVSIGVLGLYLAFAIPIFLRWRAGSNFTPGPWTLGNKYRWLAPIALIEIIITSIAAIMPTNSGGAPWYGAKVFAWKYVNYAPIVLLVALLALWIGWHLSAKKWFTGPKMTIDLPEGVTSADEIALEHEHKGFHQPPES